MVTLDASKLFRQLPAAELKSLQGAAQRRTYAAGAEVFKEGDPGDGVYVVGNGQVEISALVASNQRHSFSVLSAGDFFGEMAVLDQQPRSACALARTAAEVYFIPREELIALLTRSPELCMTLLQEISRRIREFNQQYVRELLQAERMALIGRFASSIVHDLKNPLTIIGIAAEVACLETSTVEGRRTAEQRIHKQVERITGMVNEILEFTRGGTTRMALALVDYGTFVNSLVEELQRDVARKAVILECVTPPPSLKLKFNPQRLTRVFYNLVLNAVDEMPEGGHVRLDFKVTDAEVITEVADSGKGIAPEIIDSMFEPFATYGKAKGTGLGLSICRRILDEHGGRIWAQNRPEGGALFAFALPRVEA